MKELEEVKESVLFGFKKANKDYEEKVEKLINGLITDVFDYFSKEWGLTKKEHEFMFFGLRDISELKDCPEEAKKIIDKVHKDIQSWRNN